VVRGYGLPRDEQQDLIQEAALQCWARFGAFDPARAALSTYIELVVASKMTWLIRARLAAKRSSGTVESLTDLDGEPVAHTPDLCLRLDVFRTLSRLPVAAQEVVLMLADDSPTDVSRATAISRTAIYRIIQKARAAFIEAGLRPTKPTSARGRPSPSFAAGRLPTRSQEASDANGGC